MKREGKEDWDLSKRNVLYKALFWEEGHVHGKRTELIRMRNKIQRLARSRGWGQELTASLLCKTFKSRIERISAFLRCLREESARKRLRLRDGSGCSRFCSLSQDRIDDDSIRELHNLASIHLPKLSLSFSFFFISSMLAWFVRVYRH